MKTQQDIADFVRSSVLMALDQQDAYKDSIASFAENVVDTLNEWKVPGDEARAALDSYYFQIGKALARIATTGRQG